MLLQLWDQASDLTTLKINNHKKERIIALFLMLTLLYCFGIIILGDKTGKRISYNNTYKNIFKWSENQKRY